jgi:cell fate (sporulation/competence/biofilm development) regulator YlbF (YheA/YmcA/DUF963 family)
MTKPQKHHIVPTYRCIELGLTTSYKIASKEFYFKENMVEVTRHQHALIHWGYMHNDLKPLLEVCNPPQWVIDMIPIGDNRDVGAATITARGEIEQIDMSGKNHPMWKGGIAVGDNLKEYMKAYNQTPKIKSYMKAYSQTPKMKEWHKAYNQTPKVKEYQKEYRQTPERIAYMKEYMKAYNQTPKVKAYMKAYYQAKKKIERKGQGTLEQFL